MLLNLQTAIKFERNKTMIKAMLFIDGTWLYKNTPKLSESFGNSDYHINYGLLPKVLAEDVVKQMGLMEVDLVRTFIFGSYPVKYSPQDEDLVASQIDFFDMLKEEYNYEVEKYPINFRGVRIRKKDRKPGDAVPEEKCVDIALASSVSYYAAIPHAYDIAIVLIGDRDFIPVLQHVRKLGKRVAIASIKDRCALEYSDFQDRERVKDTDIIWLDNILNRIELKYEKQQLECQSPLHDGPKKVWTTFRPRKGKPFFCDICRQKFTAMKHQDTGSAQQQMPSDVMTNGEATPGNESDDISSMPLYVPQTPQLPLTPAVPPEMVEGMIIKLLSGYGFIKGVNQREYYFNVYNLQDFIWEDLYEGLEVSFEVLREPADGKAGAARNVKQKRVVAQPQQPV